MASLLLDGETWLSAKRAKDLATGLNVIFPNGKLYRLTAVTDAGAGMKLVGVRTSTTRPFSMQRSRIVVGPEEVLLIQDIRPS